MPLPIIAEAFSRGISGIPYASTILRVATFLVVVYLLKVYFGGAKNSSERLLHSKVVMITVRTMRMTAPWP